MSLRPVSDRKSKPMPPRLVSLPLIVICVEAAIVQAGQGSTAQSKVANAGRLQGLVRQLDSPRFADRQAAAKDLRKIGEPAIAALREVVRTSESLESRRRAEALINTIRQDAVQRLVVELKKLDTQAHGKEEELRKLGEVAAGALQQALLDAPPGFRRRVEVLLQLIEEDKLEQAFRQAKQAEEKKDYRKAIAILTEATRRLKQRARKSDNVPLLTKAFMHLGHARRKMGDFEGAARAYQQAAYHSNNDNLKRQEIERACAAMIAELVPAWKKAVRAQIDRDPALKALAAKYPLVVLHSRRFAAGSYLQSCYSFVYETADPERHFNDVQLQFDNGRADRTFQVNMIGGQKNAVFDLGKVDFEADPLKRPLVKAQDDATAVAGHVYLEKIEDSTGNSFLVLFQVMAVDPASQYLAFIWRRLPGGKVVRRN